MNPRPVVWSEAARVDLRQLERDVAVRINRAVVRFAEMDQGDVQKLKGWDPVVWRLRVGDWRVIFRVAHGEIQVGRVLNRRDAYRP